MLLPSPRYVRANYEPAHAWQVPFFYVYRPLRFVARCLGARGV